MKHEWKKAEKHFYIPKNKPELITIPNFNFYTITGEGDPNSDFFKEYIAVLYALSYAIKMSPKKGMAPKNYTEYTVYPLEGIWDLNEKGRQSYNGTIDKNDLVFKLMIRQPDFVQEDFALTILDYSKKSKPHPLLEQVKFETITDGQCIQMLHLGSFDEEWKTFKAMTDFAALRGFERICKTHREIYLSDARKVSPDKLKTVLRFKVGKVALTDTTR